MTEEEVVQLYRGLLGRDPETADTIQSFLSYYPSAERGQRAILNSDEFERRFVRLTGRTPVGRDPASATLALLLLARAAAAAPMPPPPPPPDRAVRAGLRSLLEPAADRPEPSFAVVIGAETDLALDDLVPLGAPQAAILQMAPGLPPAVPIAGTLEDGTAIFRLGGDAGTLATILRQFDRRIDALYLLGRPADPGWVDALHDHFAGPMLLVVGRAQDGFDAVGLSAAIDARHPAESVQRWRGLHVHHMGGWMLPVTYDPPLILPPPPDLTGYPSLAVAAIVRDEAVCVCNMLASTLPVASFYAVLDTGSIDATPTLVQDFLAASGIDHAFVQRDHTAFDDDFAAMRNAALAMVPDWIEWVLMLDADEELAPEDHTGVLTLIATATHEIHALPRYNFPGADKTGPMVSYPDRQIRLLRHTPDGRIGYRGVVHETVTGVPFGRPPLDATAIGGERGGPHIHHLVRRFRTPEQEERKQAFYREIARRRP